MKAPRAIMIARRLVLFYLRRWVTTREVQGLVPESLSFLVKKTPFGGSCCCKYVREDAFEGH